MAWIESHQQLERHPKTHALMRLMGWDLDIAIGKLHRFWWWCMDFAPTGDLRERNDAVIAGSVGLAENDGARFVDAMVQSGWIDRADGIFRVHDWLDYAGRYLKESKFKRHPKKLKELRAVYRPRTVRGLSELPDQTRPNQPNNYLSPGAEARDGPENPANPHRSALRKSTLAAFEAWSSIAPPVGRGHGLNLAANEHSAVFSLLDLVAQESAIARSSEVIPRQNLAAKAAECCAREGVGFRNVKYACGCVKNRLERWANEGISGNGESGRNGHGPKSRRDQQMEIIDRALSEK